ncbi:hypothetical protein WJX81_005393 [Elliptochloris bilobata]|uniref:Nucleotide-diphospho-sugar transferase domain-containing protein n=1 Tax=Elliptochloris bilobata TaxID=381761 RepID=A0AAW1RMR2_9CHLO
MPPATQPLRLDTAGGFVPGAAVAGLTIAAARSTAREGLLYVTFANAHVLDFALNWVDHMVLLDLRNFLVGALDGKALAHLQNQGIPCFAAYQQNSSISQSEGAFQPGSEAFGDMVRLRLALAAAVGAWGLDLVICDVDTLWLRDPGDFFDTHMRADVLVASEALSTTSEDGEEALEQPAALLSPLSTGLLFLRHGAGAAAALAAWMAAAAADPATADHVHFAALARHGRRASPRSVLGRLGARRLGSRGGGVTLASRPGDARLALGFGGATAVGVLPLAAFGNGHTFFVQRLHESMRVMPYAVHAGSSAAGGWATRRHRLREAGLWFEDAALREDAGRFLDDQRTQYLALSLNLSSGWETWDPLAAAGDQAAMLAYHREHLQQQLDQLGAALAMSAVMRLPLILPQFVCYCDVACGKAAERCRRPGAEGMILPFTCPLDYILQPGRLDDDPARFGPALDVRERSFLDHPRAAWLTQAKSADVFPLREEVPATRLMSSALWLRGRLVVPRFAPAEQLANIFEEHAQVRLLRLNDASNMFGNPGGARAGLRARLEHLQEGCVAGSKGAAAAGGASAGAFRTYSLLPKLMRERRTPSLAHNGGERASDGASSAEDGMAADIGDSLAAGAAAATSEAHYGWQGQGGSEGLLPVD